MHDSTCCSQISKARTCLPCTPDSLASAFDFAEGHFTLLHSCPQLILQVTLGDIAQHWSSTIRSLCHKLREVNLSPREQITASLRHHVEIHRAPRYEIALHHMTNYPETAPLGHERTSSSPSETAQLKLRWIGPKLGPNIGSSLSASSRPFSPMDRPKGEGGRIRQKKPRT